MTTDNRKAEGSRRGNKASAASQWLCGLNPVREALRAGTLGAVYLYSGRRRLVGELLREAETRGVPVKVMHDRGFFDSRFPKGHQGVAGETTGPRFISIERLLEIPREKGAAPFFVVLDLIEDPRNLGAILRSAEAAGVQGVVSQERRSAGLGPEARKASAGASEHIPFCMVGNVKHAVDRMKQEGVTIIGAEAGSHPAPWDIEMNGPLALVIGSEGRGLRRTVREKCDFIVSLPMRGRVGSLNASASAAVLIYEALRQREKG